MHGNFSVYQKYRDAWTGRFARGCREKKPGAEGSAHLERFPCGARSAPPTLSRRRKKKGGCVAAAALESESRRGRMPDQNFNLTPPWILQRVSPLLTTICEAVGKFTLPSGLRVTVGRIWPEAL